MFKKILKILVSFVLLVVSVNAELININKKVKGIVVTIQSQRSLVVGDNIFFVTLKKDGDIIDDAKIKAKFFMPEMPGMPYMEYIAAGKYEDEKYKMLINFSMNGTWQYHLKFRTKDRKIYKTRGSINL